MYCCFSSHFFIFHKLIQVRFPSVGWSPCIFVRCDKSRIPLDGFSSPSVWASGSDPQGLLLCFDPFVMFCVSIFHQLLSRFFLCTQSNLLIHLLGLMCSLCHPRMRSCCLGHVHRMFCLLLAYLHSFCQRGCLFHLRLLCFS